MAYLPLDLTLISAKDLNVVNHVSKMYVYAIATLDSDPSSKQRTSVDKGGGKNPTWNFAMKFFIPTANPDDLVLHIQLKSEHILGDHDVGEVHIPIKELLEVSPSDPAAAAVKLVDFHVRKPSGKRKGILKISYKIGDKVAPPQPPQPPAFTTQKFDEPVTAYPAAVAGYSAYPTPAWPYPLPAGAYPPPAAAYPYPPPQPADGYGAPRPQPQLGFWYGYLPPPQPGYVYGYPAQAQAQAAEKRKKRKKQKKQKKKNFWMGLGAELVADTVGGLLVGDMISDASDSEFDGSDFDF